MSTDVVTPTIEVQLDTAVFPASTVVDITDVVIGGDVNLAVDADNGSATVNVSSMPGDADEGVRLYCYADGDLIFNGAISGLTWNADGSGTIAAQDALAKLRHAWGGADRTYNSTGDPMTDDTDTSTAQNIVEASGIDASLTSIQGEGRSIGTVQDVVISGGNIGIDGNPTQATVMMDVLRLLDQSVIPNHATFTRGDGAVYRRPREIGSSVASFADGSGGSAWGFTRSRDINTIVNKWLVKGLVIAGVPTESEASAANSYLVAPWEYNTGELSSYLIDDQTWADDLAAWLLSDTNGRLNTVSWTSAINNDESLLGATVTVTSSRIGLSGQLVYVTTIRHHWDGQTATTQFDAVFRD